MELVGKPAVRPRRGSVCPRPGCHFRRIDDDGYQDFFWKSTEARSTIQFSVLHRGPSVRNVLFTVGVDVEVKTADTTA